MGRVPGHLFCDRREGGASSPSLSIRFFVVTPKEASSYYWAGVPSSPMDLSKPSSAGPWLTGVCLDFETACARIREWKA